MNRSPLAEGGFFAPWLLCLFLPLISTYACAKDTTFICDTVGSAENYGLYQTEPIRVKFSQQVLLRIGMYDNSIISMSVEPINECKGNQLFRCNWFHSVNPKELTVTESNLALRKKFISNISTWEQSASLNRYTLKLDVSTNREYLRPPSEGLFVNYSGTCTELDKQI